MDYQKIKYFLKAAETLNFSEAARQMFITPQAFGKQITVLEQEMGFALFERSNRQLRLTSMGQICYAKLAGIVSGLEQEYEQICEMGNHRKRQINLGFFNALSLKKVVSPIVTSVLARFPDRDVNISMCDMGELKEQIKNGKLDLCITSTHETEPGWTNCSTLPLMRTSAKIVVSGYHSWMLKETVSVEDMLENDFIKIDLPQFSEKDYFVTVPCKKQRVAPNYESMCLSLEQGDCFTIMSSEIDSYCEKSGKVFDLPSDSFDFELALISNKDNTHSFLPELCQFIKEEFEP